jgi:Delta7-sterol 5-desaturase
MLLPWLLFSLIVFRTLSILFNLIGHFGYEVYLRCWKQFPILRWRAAGCHHYMHHQRIGGNSVFYFCWWNILCKTEFRDYEERYDWIFAKEASQEARDST